MAFAESPSILCLSTLVRRIRDPVLLLPTRPAAQRDASPAQHRVSANIVVRLDHDHRRPLIARHDGRRQARGSGSDNHNVGGPVEMNLAGLCCGGGSEAGGCRSAL